MTETMTKPFHCSICQLEITDDKFGNNAWPVNMGQCCDRCNAEVVLPARVRRRTRPEAV